MKYLISLNSDSGLVLKKNQDCCLALTGQYGGEEIAFAVVCDGMGGLSHGEVASEVTVDAFKRWITSFLSIDASDVKWEEIRSQWRNLIISLNQKIGEYGAENAAKLGTTLTAALFVGNKYLAVNVGDTRLYKITDKVKRITRDHTLVEFKVRQGSLTAEEARVSPEKNILLQCIGASEEVFPDFHIGDVNEEEVYFLCSDGFRNKLIEDELFDNLSPKKLVDKQKMNEASEFLINLNKSRNERDNISIVIVKSVR